MGKKRENLIYTVVNRFFPIILRKLTRINIIEPRITDMIFSQKKMDCDTSQEVTIHSFYNYAMRLAVSG